MSLPPVVTDFIRHQKTAQLDPVAHIGDDRFIILGEVPTKNNVILHAAV